MPFNPLSEHPDIAVRGKVSNCMHGVAYIRAKKKIECSIYSWMAVLYVCVRVYMHASTEIPSWICGQP